MKLTSVTFLTVSVIILSAVVSCGKREAQWFDQNKPVGQKNEKEKDTVKINVEEKKVEDAGGHDSYGNTIRGDDDAEKIDLDSEMVALVHSETPGWWEENPTAQQIAKMKEMLKEFREAAGDDEMIQLDEWKKLAAKWNLTDDTKVEELFRKAAGADLEMSFDEFARIYRFRDIAQDDWMISMDEWLALFDEDSKEMAKKLFEDASKLDVADGEDHQMSFGEYMMVVEFLKVGGPDGQISKEEWNKHYEGHEDVFHIVAGADDVVDFEEFSHFYQFYMIAGDDMIISSEEWQKAGMDTAIFDLLAGDDHQITIDEYLPYLEFKTMAGDDGVIDEAEWKKNNKPMGDFKKVAGDDDTISLQEYLDYVRNPAPTSTPEAEEQTNPAGKDEPPTTD